MPKKKLQPSAPPMTRGQMSRAERERQQMRNLYTMVIAVVTVVVLILGFSVFSAFVLKPNEEVAKVNGVTISRATYNKVRRWNLFQEIQRNAAQSGTGLSAGTTTGQLADVENESTLDATTVGQLVDREVLRQKALADFQISASQEELKQGAIKFLGVLPTPTLPPEPTSTIGAGGTITAANTITPTNTRTFTPGPATKTPSKTATLPPVAGAQETAEAAYTNYVKAIDQGTAPRAGDLICVFGCPDLSEQDFLSLIVEPGVLQEKVTDHFASQIMTQVEQIHAQHILTDTEAGGKAIIEMLDKGADFSETANTQSSEQISNIQRGMTGTGGDLGWFPKEGSSYVPEFVNGAWTVQAGTYTTLPVKTTFGYHVIKVLERDPKRELSEDELEAQKSKRYEDWFTATKTAWAANITTKLPAAPVIPTQPVITEPTQPAVTEPTQPPEGTEPTQPPAEPGTTPEGGGASTPAATP